MGSSIFGDLKVNDFLTQELIDINNKRLNDMVEKIRTDTNEFALFLGAGVSANIGLPLWGNLITRMAKVIIHNAEQNDLFQKLLDEGVSLFNGINAPETAEYFRNYFDSMPVDVLESESRAQKTPMNEFLIASLVKGILTECYEKAKTNADWSLLEAIVKLLASDDNPTGIKHVLTYNFDDALEKACFYKGVSDQIESLTVSKLRFAEPETPFMSRIYHIHGRTAFLVEDLATEDMRNSFYGGLIFTETKYRERDRDTYGAANACHAHLLSAYKCLAVGLSFQDDSLRRLLNNRLPSEDPPRHYILLDVDTIMKEMRLPFPSEEKNPEFDEFLCTIEPQLAHIIQTEYINEGIGSQSNDELYKAFLENIEKIFDKTEAKTKHSDSASVKAAKELFASILGLRSNYLFRKGFCPILLMRDDICGVIERVGDALLRPL